MAAAPEWRVGGFFGALSHQPLWPPNSCRSLLVCPWRLKLQPDYIIGGHAIYTAYRFQAVPVDIEIEAGVAQRFGRSHATEFYLAPILRWKAFPWNDYVYTTFRLGLVGASYTTSVSAWERSNATNGKGSRYLNYLLLEGTFAPSATSPVEAFVRLHHRSGIYGLIGGVRGGSNYVGVGLRYTIQ